MVDSWEVERSGTGDHIPGFFVYIYWHFVCAFASRSVFFVPGDTKEVQYITYIHETFDTYKHKYI